MTKITRVKRSDFVRRNNSNRDWWLVKYGSATSGFIQVGKVSLPKRYIGKRVKLKLVVMD